MIKAAAVFCDNMVFQARKPINVFGTGNGEVKIEFMGMVKSVNSDGNWLIEFEPQSYGGPYEMSMEANGIKTVFRDIYVGEVLLCAGQSNMEMRMGDGILDKPEYTDDPLLRLYSVTRQHDDPAFTEKDGWVKSAPENIDRWSALGYLCGKRLREKGCAVGIVLCCQGATVIQTWMDEGHLSEPLFHIPDELLSRDHSIKEYALCNNNSYLYYKMLQKIAPFTVSACVWYQGESNDSDAESRIYLDLLAAMIDNWRADFKDAKLPFVIVQIADYLPRLTEEWKRIQDLQLKAESVIPYTGTVISRDICENDLIHPVSKTRLADRIYDKWKEITV